MSLGNQGPRSARSSHIEYSIVKRCEPIESSNQVNACSGKIRLSTSVDRIESSYLRNMLQSQCVFLIASGDGNDVQICTRVVITKLLYQR